MLQPFPKSLFVKLEKSDSRVGVPQLLKSLPIHVPAFFLVDPYGHPLSVPVLNQILKRGKTEVFINLMWFRINMDLSNPQVETRMTEFFGDDDWRRQGFNRLKGSPREQGFLNYFKSRLECRYFLPFKVRYDPEDKTGGDRTKYYLIHASNHIKALLLMKTVMWPLGDEEGTFDFSGESQGILISMAPTEDQLSEILIRQFAGQVLRFDEVLEKTWELPFIEKHYRSVLKKLEGHDVKITRISSKKTGIKGDDRILFHSQTKDRS